MGSTLPSTTTSRLCKCCYDMMSIDRGKQERTFERGMRDLKDLEIVVEKEKRLHLHGHEEPEEVHFDIGSKNLRLVIPVKREIAKSIIRKSPSLKRQATAHKVLGEVGLLERSR